MRSWHAARRGNGLDEHAALLWFTQNFDLGKRKRAAKQPDYDDYPEYGGP